MPGGLFLAKFSGDDACTTQVAADLDHHPPGIAYAYIVAIIEGAQTVPDPRHRVLRALEELPADRPVFRRISGKCARVRRLPGERYFAVGEEVAPTKFVAFTRRVVRLLPAAQAATKTETPRAAASGSRISVSTEQFIGKDGSATTATERLRDEKLGTDCSIALVARCLPKDSTFAAYPRVFADPSCKRLLAERQSTMNPDPSYAMAATDEGTWRFFHVAGEYPANEPIFRIDGDQCVEIERWSKSYFALGPEIAPTDFVSFKGESVESRAAPETALLVPLDSSRISIKLWWRVGADGSVTLPMIGGYQDEKLRVACELGTAADGLVRCLPTIDHSVGWLFADAQCTTPLTQGRIDRNSYARSQSGDELSGIRYHLFPIGAAYDVTRAVFASARSGKCSAYPYSSMAAVPLWTVGPEIPAKDFVAFGEPGPSRDLRGPRKPR